VLTTPFFYDKKFNRTIKYLLIIKGAKGGLMKLSKRTWMGIFAVFVVLLVGGGFIASNKLKDITISEAEVQSKITEKLPLAKEKMMTRATISNITVKFREGSIETEFRGKVELFKKSADFVAFAKGNLRYDGSKGGFYFQNSNVEIRELELAGFEAGNKIKDRASVAISVAASTYLNNYPIYKLPDSFKGKAIKISLKSLEVNEGSITAHLSFWQLTATVFGFLIAAIFCVIAVIAIAYNPNAFEGIMWP
jgi:hypothetical protein